MRTKRRLLYLPDEEAELLSELTNSPRPRPSRLSRLAILSSDDNKIASADNGTVTPAAEVVDSALLVSYNSYALADGSGTLHPPLASGEAMALYKSLRKCCRFVRTFLKRQSTSQTTTDSLSSSTLEYDESSDLDSEYESPQRRQKRCFKEAETLSQNEGNYASMTVVELRELLRERNLPISGPKALLISRLQDSDERLPSPEENGQSVHMMSAYTGGESSEVASSFSSSEAEHANPPQTMWSAILDMGSRLFRKSTGSLPEGNTASYRKRRRSE
ncbi:hypothetical protein TraAM80_06239 [Trypanosoma rangeli]|uniref:SAP domain-containing protein n=1 Tax=Trypanosoma rangeli TaxID=5698 RepID=A0A422NB21_TRYRA|nr:uncharacterized protein TraAM80_06239 [Trypanosoma rangeli]RNF02653.1 hypothetical protein TraAM80_06239 [Trypanosoma rangeli]|eukprot:RNF02653.1 hypothetical protein TraAM80_06239 [Trypanosoma rangeli]